MGQAPPPAILPKKNTSGDTGTWHMTSLCQTMVVIKFPRPVYKKNTKQQQRENTTTTA